MALTQIQAFSPQSRSRWTRSPAIFALSVDEAAGGVQSEFNVWYLDDATLGDSPESVPNDLVVLLETLRAIDLEVDGRKCELAILNDSMSEATEGGGPVQRAPSGNYGTGCV